MRGWLTLVVVGVALMTMPGWAQMRGARGAPHASRAPMSGFHTQGFHATAVNRPSFHSGFHAQGFHGAAMSRPSFHAGFSPRFRSNFHSSGAVLSFRSGFSPRFRSTFRSSGFHTRFRDHHNGFDHRGFDHGGFGTVWPYDYGYLGYYPSYPLFGNEYDSGNDERYYQPQQEIPYVNYEYEQQRDLRSMPTPLPQRNEPASMPSTTLVFRNGKTEQIQNYAIAGQTLWVFNQQRESKIPLSELDVSATQTLNEEHGVSFQIPSQ